MTTFNLPITICCLFLARWFAFCIFYLFILIYHLFINLYNIYCLYTWKLLLGICLGFFSVNNQARLLGTVSNVPTGESLWQKQSRMKFLLHCKVVGVVAMCCLASQRTGRVVTLNSTPRLLDRGFTVPWPLFVEPSLVNPDILRPVAILSW